MGKPLSSQFENLQVLHIVKETLAISFKIIADILKNSPRLTEFYVTTTKIIDASDENFIHLFLTTPHLAMLEVFSLCLTCPDSPTITGCLAMFLVGHCPALRRVDKMVTWNIGLDQLDKVKVEEAGFALVMARRSHWSLPWRGDDGTYQDDAL